MKKKLCLAVLMALVLVIGSVACAQPKIIPPFGEGQIGIGAVVLQEEHPVYKEASEASQVAQTLKYGQWITLMDPSEGWAKCVLSDDVDASPAGWIRMEGLLIDPAVCFGDEDTPVYASNDAASAVIRTLGEYTIVPVLKNESEWVLVNVAGTDGWIHLDSAPERWDGERFETTFMIEGMEETVKYEHARNDSLGFAIDFDYETFERRIGEERECFVSLYDDPENPAIYLEIVHCTGDAESVCKEIGEELAKSYDVRTDTLTLERAGDCTVIDAAQTLGDGSAQGALQTIYIIPAAEGCFVATAHYTYESADGFSARFGDMMNTFAILEN